jgi:hypothetical protein
MLALNHGERRIYLCRNREEDIPAVEEAIKEGRAEKVSESKTIIYHDESDGKPAY